MKKSVFLIASMLSVLFSCKHEDKSSLSSTYEMISTNNSNVVRFQEKTTFEIKDHERSYLTSGTSENKHLRNQIIKLSALQIRGKIDLDKHLNIGKDLISITVPINKEIESASSNTLDVTVTVSAEIPSHIQDVEIDDISLLDETDSNVRFGHFSVVWESSAEGNRSGVITVQDVDTDTLKEISKRGGHLVIRPNQLTLNDKIISENILNDSAQHLIVSTSSGTNIYQMNKNISIRKNLVNLFPDAVFNGNTIVSINKSRSEISPREIQEQITQADLDKNFWNLIGVENLDETPDSETAIILVESKVKQFVDVHTKKAFFTNFTVVGEEPNIDVEFPKSAFIFLKIKTAKKIANFGFDGNNKIIKSFNEEPIAYKDVSSDLLQFSSGGVYNSVTSSSYTLSSSSNIKGGILFFGGNHLLRSYNKIQFNAKPSPILDYWKKSPEMPDAKVPWCSIPGVLNDPQMSEACIPRRENIIFTISAFTLEI